MVRFRHHWYRLPVHVRKPLVLVVGLLFVIAAPFTGVLPGPGGIPVFLIGVAILATEFEWAQRIRDPIIEIVGKVGAVWRRHKITGTLVIILCALIFCSLSFMIYRKIHT